VTVDAAGRLQSIDDWDRPWLPWPVRALNRIPDGVARRMASLDEAPLLQAAMRSTGLHDFGDPAFREPLGLLLDDLNNDEHLTPLGRITARTLLGQLLRARLRVEDRLARHPEVALQEVRSPIVIVGLPRTGTTHLHNLLSEVPGLRSLPLWESIEPLPRERWGIPVPDLRRARTALRMRQLDYLLPLFRSMHPMEADLPHEELQLSALTFRSFFFEGSFRLPRYRPWYAAGDQREAYAYLRRVLQLLQGVRARGRWVLKSPQHLEQIDALRAAFPDAKIVRTHRDPVRAVLSLATMITYTRRACYRDLDPAREGRAWAVRLEQMLRASLEQADRLPPGCTLDVRFDDFVREPAKTVEQVLAFAGADRGAEVDVAARERVREHVPAHDASRSERFAYRFEDLGLDRDELRERFRFYRERFDLPDEA
jgi:hypothetical protein